MKTIAKKLWELAIAIEKEKEEEFTLFALVLPEDAIAWDLMIAAKWTDSEHQQALRYLIQKVQHVLTKAELRELSGVLLFDSENFEPVTSLTRSEHGRKETNIDFYGKRV